MFESKLLDGAALVALMSAVLSAPWYFFTSTYLGFFGIPIYPNLWECISFFVRVMTGRPILSVLYFVIASLLYIFLMKKTASLIKNKTDKAEGKCAPILNFIYKRYEKIFMSVFIVVLLIVNYLFSLESSLDDLARGSQFSLFVLVSLLPLIFCFGVILSVPTADGSVAAIFNSTDGLKNKRENIIWCVFGIPLSFLVISLASNNLIKDAMQFPRREADLYRVWMDDKHEYLLSCGEEDKGVVYVRESMVNSANMAKNSIMLYAQKAEIVRLRDDDYVNICKRMSRK